MTAQPRIVLQDPVLRRRLSAIPEKSWYIACQTYWELSPNEMPTKSVRDDVRQRIRWVRTPNRRSVGQLPGMLLPFVKVAADHLAREGFLTDPAIPDSPEGWKDLLDCIAKHLGLDYVKFCHLIAPPDLNWTSPELSEVTETVTCDEDQFDGDTRLVLLGDSAESKSSDAGAGTKATSEQLTAILDQLRSTASDIIHAFEAASADIDDAQLIDSDLANLIESWNDTLTLFACGLHGDVQFTSGGLDVLEAEVDRVREEEESNAERRELLKELSVKLTQFEDKRDDELYDSDEDYRGFVDRRIADLTREIDEVTYAHKVEGVEVDGQSEFDYSVDNADSDSPATESAAAPAISVDADDESDDANDLDPDSSGECLADSAESNPVSAPGVPPGIDRDEAADATPEVTSSGAAATPDGAVEDEVEESENSAPASHEGPLSTQTAVAELTPAQDDHSVVVDHRDVLIEADLAVLIGRNQWAAASAVAAASDLEDEVIRALDFCSEAFSLSIISTDPYEMLGRNATSIVETLQAPGTDAALLTVVGVLRTCLQFGREQYWQLTEESLEVLPGQWREAGRALRDAVADGYQHRWENKTVQNSTVPPALMKRESENLRVTLPKRNNKFQRASNVLRYMMNPGGDLACALDAVAAWADGDSDIDKLRACRLVLNDPRKLIDRNDGALHGGKQKKAPIVSKAYENLAGRIGEVAQLLDRTIAVAESTTKQAHTIGPHVEDMRDVVHNLPQIELDGGLGTAVLERFRAWLVSGEGPTADVGRTFDQLKFVSSLPAVSAIRDEHFNLPVKSPISGYMMTRELLEPRSENDLFQAYLERGNLIAAGEVRSDTDSMLALRTAQRDWRDRIKTQTVGLQSDLLRMQTHTQVDPVDRARIEGRITGLSTVLDDRFDVASNRALTIADELATLWDVGRMHLLDSLNELNLTLGIPPDDSERIRTLVDQNDFITAREFMSIISNDSGRSLPPAEDSGLTELLGFHALLESWDHASTNALEITQNLLGSALPDPTVTALKSWNQGQRARKPSEWLRLLPSILQLLGLDKDPHIPVADKTNRNQNRVGKFLVKATPNGGSYVAALGSSTRRKGYAIYVVPVENSVESVFDMIPTGERRDAALMLYPGVLSWDDRKKIRAAAEKKKVTALVIDTPTLVYMAMEGNNKFTSLQRISLPFSIFPHWAPRVAGDVPDELFVGRVEEIDQIISLNGSIFVYGGRQLGKSALLHRIERDFNRIENHLAIYIDFKFERIGEENQPEHLWTVLRNRLQDKEIIPASNSSTKPDAIGKKIREWLDGDPHRRILLLCDETDAFLQNEARERMVENRSASFPNLAALKGMMDETHRRFKPVFAGLHQVQRIADTPNSPLAHGGEDILVGPLNTQEAWELVVRPFKALGYQFESLDLVWRLLAFTNDHAGLVQIVCDELYKYLRSHRVLASEPPYIVRTADVDHVITSKNVRDFIAERFRLTIQLEDRYFVVSMVIALLGLDNGFENRYSQGEILEHCRVYWSGGFESLSEDELSVYLDEMVGLGVLVRGNDRYYGMRSPNVVHMLGDRDTIENQLLEGRFELPLQYNARVSRRRVSASRGSEKYSPLTEHELSRVMPKRTGIGRDQYTFAIIGSAALGIGSVQGLLTSCAEGYEYGLDLISAAESKELVRAAAGTIAKRPLVVCDATDAPEHLEEIVERIGAAQKANIGRRGVLLGSFGASVSRELAALGVEVVPLQLWTVETVRATIDSPITNPAQREEFVRVNGGWPSLCERYLDEIRMGTAVSDAIIKASKFPANGEEASTFLSDTGVVDAADLTLLTAWADIAEDGDVIDLHTLAELLATSVDNLSDVIGRFNVLSIVAERSEGIALNDVIHRSLKAIEVVDA